jgi:hypothetical protein
MTDKQQGAETVAGDPDPRDLVHELREALGWPVVALPISPKQAWEEALAAVRRLAGTREIDREF